MTDPNRLLDRYLDDQLSPEDLEVLEQDLAGNTEYADAFAAAMMMDAMLGERFEREKIANTMQLQDGSYLGEDLRVLCDDYEHAVTETVTLVEIGDTRKHTSELSVTDAVSVLSVEMKHLVRERPMPFILSGVAAAAAVLLVALVLINPFASQAPAPIADRSNTPAQSPTIGPIDPTGRVVAFLTGQREAQWQGVSGTALPDVGDALHAGDRLLLTAGTAEITTKDGAVAILEAPAKIELLDDNALRLHSGKLVGICETESSKGFVVSTPHMDVTDLGTRFCVDLTNSDAAEVHVLDGEVLVSMPDRATPGQAIEQRLIQHQAVRADALAGTLEPIKASFETFAALTAYSLRSTGYQLAEGAIDPHWQVVADANGPLDRRLPLIVQHSYKPELKLTHYPAEGNDPNVAQWLFFSTKLSNYYPHESPVDIDASRLTLESRFDIDDAVDLRDKVLYLRFASGGGLSEMRINGTEIKDLPERGAQDGKTLWHEVEVPIHQTSLRNGQNTLQVDLNNQITSHLASFYLQWELRPKQPNTTPDQDAQPRG